MTESATLATVVAESLRYDRLPDFYVYTAAGDAVVDTIERVAVEGDA